VLPTEKATCTVHASSHRQTAHPHCRARLWWHQEAALSLSQRSTQVITTPVIRAVASVMSCPHHVVARASIPVGRRMVYVHPPFVWFHQRINLSVSKRRIRFDAAAGRTRFIEITICEAYERVGQALAGVAAHSIAVLSQSCSCSTCLALQHGSTGCPEVRPTIIASRLYMYTRGQSCKKAHACALRVKLMRCPNHHQGRHKPRTQRHKNTHIHAPRAFTRKKRDQGRCVTRHFRRPSTPSRDNRMGASVRTLVWDRGLMTVGSQPCPSLPSLSCLGQRSHNSTGCNPAASLTFPDVQST
jgi:hypothetical protein